MVFYVCENHKKQCLQSIFGHYMYINRYLNHSVLSPQMSPLLILFVFVMPKMSPQTSSQVSSLHKKSGVHNRSNRLEHCHYRISRLNTT